MRASELGRVGGVREVEREKRRIQISYINRFKRRGERG
jgi:hypothetical protein